MSLTSQFVISVFMALGQFIEPYSDQQVKSFVDQKKTAGEELAQWELDAYKFKPLNPKEILGLSIDGPATARYLRSTCLRALSSTQTEQTIARGGLISLDFDFLLRSVVKPEMVEKLQNRIIKSEQGIKLSEAKDIVKKICDVSIPIEQLASESFQDAANYYVKLIGYLPQINSVKDLPKLSEVSFIKDAKGTIIGEYSTKEVNKDLQIVQRNRRQFSKNPIPLKIKKAIVAIEDGRFWNFKPKGKGYKGHNGVDFKGIMRALQATGTGDVQGASTITMQLAKNLLLYKDVFNEHYHGKRSLLRKLKEYILVDRLEKVLTKDQILEWYLNTVDFGRESQGIVMAARSYFNKPIDKLNIQEIALLAGLPKAPNALDPEKNYTGALKRRNKVLKDLKSEGYITSAERNAAKKTEIKFKPDFKFDQKSGYAQFYVSAVQNQMRGWLKSLNKDQGLGFDITVPINHLYQKWAVESLQRGLLKFERKRRILTVKPGEDRLPNIKTEVEKLAAEKANSKLTSVYSEVLKKIKNSYVDAGQFHMGVIIGSRSIGLTNGELVRRQPDDRRGKLYKIVDGRKRNLAEWDVVLLQKLQGKKAPYYRIASFTKTQGAIVVLDNKTGEVLATSGGFSVGAGLRYKGPGGNRSFTAYRQPGSTVKPFAYLYAMMKGVSPSQVISNKSLKLPIKKINGDKVCNSWKVTGSSSESSTYSLRQGLEKSKNRLTVNTFLKAIGMKNGDNLNDWSQSIGEGVDGVLSLMQSYGLYGTRDYACAPILLGAEEVRPVDMAAAYGAISNGGIYNKASMIRTVTRKETTISPFKAGKVATPLANAIRSANKENRKEIFNLFRLRTMLQGVVKRGTAKSMSDWSGIVAGKTGTTNRNKDAWFVGFNKDITIAVWVGRPDNKTLGSSSEGGSVAVPIFKDFMEQYYKQYPDKLNNKFSSSIEGAVIAKIEPSTGFKVNQKFQDDFKYYTGQSTLIKTVSEYFYDDAEMRSQVRDYRPGSVISGNFFYNNLSKSYRATYKKEYEAKSATSSVLYNKYKSSYAKNRDYCDEWTQKGYSDYREVVEACKNARDYKEYLEKNKPENNSFREYYLRKFKFKK